MSYLRSVESRGTSNYGFRKFISEYLINKFSSASRILDAGPGIGTYYYILNHYFQSIDCVEIHKPYIDRYNLKNKYSNVYNCDVLELDVSKYDIIIMGDVLEHLPVIESQNLIKNIIEKCQEVIVVVPWEYRQGIIDGNTHEVHEQDDLTKDIMKIRFPNLVCVEENSVGGVFVIC